MTFSVDWTTPYIPVWSQLFAGWNAQVVFMLEVGVFEGRTTLWFMENVLKHPMSHHLAVDTFEGGEDQLANGIDCQDLESKYRENLKDYKCKSFVLRGKSSEVLPTVMDKFDLIYVDGSHVAGDVYMDIQMCWPLLKVGGTLMMDDYTWELDPIVERRPKAAIDAWVEQNRSKLKIVHIGLCYVVNKEAE